MNLILAILIELCYYGNNTYNIILGFWEQYNTYFFIVKKCEVPIFNL